MLMYEANNDIGRVQKAVEKYGVVVVWESGERIGMPEQWMKV